MWNRMKARTILTAVLLMASGLMARAESTWTVTNNNGSSNTFTISRSDGTYAQKVRFRTVNLSAYAGQHYAAVDQEFTFGAGITSTTVTVTEYNPTDAYAYQNGTSRSYRFEVTDRAGFTLASADRSRTWGASVTSTGIYSEKSVTIASDEFTNKDDGYETNAYKSVSASNYFNNAAPKGYLVSAGAELRMTLSFDAKEKYDGYQYVQILVDNTTTCDKRTKNDAGGDPGSSGTPSISRYMAGFEILSGSKDESYKTYTFPVTSVGSGFGASNPWGHGTNYPLDQQRFNSDCRASDGKLIIPTNFNTLVVRFNASGSDDDDWYAKNVVAHIQALDETAPTMSAVSVNSGRHAKDNTVYVSVAFSEIVNYTGTRKLNTSWGELNYVTGSGTNVLTFSAVIPPDVTENLSVTGISGTIKDLANNSFSGVVTADNLCSLDGDLVYTLDDFQQEGGDYLITCRDDLRGLAGYVDAGNTTSGLTFRQVADITFPHTTNWNDASSTENNYARIGSFKYPFTGTYNGGNHSISGIRIYIDPSGVSTYQGLFGQVRDGGLLRNIHLADARITGSTHAGGIAGYIYDSTIEDCTVYGDVCIHAIKNMSRYHGGIVGEGYKGTSIIQRCISSATLTVADGLTNIKFYGGIIGEKNASTVSDCFALNAVVPDVEYHGAILGNDSGTSARNYYLNCTVAGAAESNTYPINLGPNVTLERTASATLPGTNNRTYDNGADIDGQPYGKAMTEIALGYSGEVGSGYQLEYSATAGTISGNILTMPAEAVTVTATLLPVVSYVDADGNEQSHVCTPIVSGTNSYGNSANAEGWYVVNSNVTISGTQGVKFLDQQVNIILCDGATLTSNATASDSRGLEVKNGSLAIYAQGGGTGRIVATAKHACAIGAKLGLDFNGGIISATTTGSIGIYIEDNWLHMDYGPVTVRRGSITAQGTGWGISAGSNITILGGTVSATATSTTSGRGLSTYYGNVSILGGNVTANGFIGINASADGSTITLGCATASDRIYASRYACSTLSIADGQTLIDDMAFGYTGTLTSEQIAAIAGKTLRKAVGAVPYIDADGTEKYCTEYTILSDDTIPINGYDWGTIGTDSQDTWYVAASNYTFNHRELDALGHVHLILCDGATFTVSGNYYGIDAEDLTIYGQSEGTGSLVASTTDTYGAQGPIYYSGALTINGGNVSTSSVSGDGIMGGDITINGGNVNATGASDGIYCYGNITLGWTKLSDRITASSYKCFGTFSIKSGQAFTDGANIYEAGDPLNPEQIAAIAGNTLRPSPYGGDASATLTAHQATLAGQTRYWTTFYHPTWNYILPGGAQAFYMGSDHALYRIGDGSVIPAGCAVVIMADKASVQLVATTDTAPTVTGNILQGTSAATTAPTGAYVMSKVEDTFGFFQFTGEIPANKAFYVQ